MFCTTYFLCDRYSSQATSNSLLLITSDWATTKISSACVLVLSLSHILTLNRSVGSIKEASLCLIMTSLETQDKQIKLRRSQEWSVIPRQDLLHAGKCFLSSKIYEASKLKRLKGLMVGLKTNSTSNSNSLRLKESSTWCGIFSCYILLRITCRRFQTTDCSGSVWYCFTVELLVYLFATCCTVHSWSAENQLYSKYWSAEIRYFAPKLMILKLNYT